MTLDRDFNHLARAYLADGPSELADRVLDDALWEVHVTRQRRPLIRVPWKVSTVRDYATVAAVAAIIVGGIGLAGFRLASAPGPGNVAPSAPSAPSSAPTASPEMPALTPAPREQVSIEGRAGRLGDAFPVPITFDVPAGWSDCSQGGHEQIVCDSNNHSVSFLIIEGISEPCGALGPVGPSVDDLVAAIVGLDGFQSTEPVEVMVDGHPGKQFELTAPATAPCALLTWATADRINGVGGGEVNLLQVIDVGGARVLIAGAIVPEADPSDGRAAVEGIMASVRIGD